MIIYSIYDYVCIVLQSKLPIPPKGYIDFVVKIFAYGEFVTLPNAHSQHLQTSSAYVSYKESICKNSQGEKAGISSKGRQQLNNGICQNSSNIYNSFRSNKSITKSDQLSIPSDATNSSTNTKHWKKVDAKFHIKYAGGEAMREGYCRQCTIAINLEQLPSVQISNWDVLPAEM